MCPITLFIPLTISAWSWFTEVNNKPAFFADKDGDGHYNVLSGLQKSIRGSDVDASLHYLARLIAEGDLDSIYRRLSVIAYEDIGLANPAIGPRLDAAINASERVGLPEARIPLGTIVCEMALSPKSNTAHIALDMALEDIEKGTGNILNRVFASERNITGDKVVFKKGNILYSKLRPYLLKILIAPDDGICTPELVPFDLYNIDTKYMMWVLRSPHVDFTVNSVSYGVKMPRVGTDTMLNLLIPLVLISPAVPALVEIPISYILL